MIYCKIVLAQNYPITHDIFWFHHSMQLSRLQKTKDKVYLPVRGEVPDMITNTNSYVKLVEIYQEQAKKDSEIMFIII